MDNTFEASIKGKKYTFKELEYAGTPGGTWYIDFYNDEVKRNEEFRMKWNEDGKGWKILAQVLPVHVYDSELELGDVIEANEYGVDDK